MLKPHLDLYLAAREHPKTICPSEVARALSLGELNTANVSDWRDLMPTVREMLWNMRSRGEVEILQKGQPILEDTELQNLKGPIRARKCI